MIGTAIVEMLEGLSLPVSPLVTVQKIDQPTITYDITGVDPSDTKQGGSDLDEVDVTISIFHRSYKSMDDLAIAVRIALDRKCGIYGEVSVQSVQFRDYSYDYDQGSEMYEITMEYTFRVDPTYQIPTDCDYASTDYSIVDYNAC